MFEQVSESIQNFGPFSEEKVKLVMEKLTLIHVQKDQFLIKEGQTCQAFYFINSGSFKHYCVEESGEESILNLFITNDWILEYKSFITQQPSQNFIQAASDSEVLSLSIWDFHALARISESFMRMGTILEVAVRNQDYQQNRLSPEEKYSLLLQTKPELLQHFSLKQIASFMRMAPETLSRIRKKITS